MAFSTVSYSTANDSERQMIRSSLFTEGTNSMDVYIRMNHYSVYEYTQSGQILTNNFISSDDAYDFVEQFCSSSSKVYLFMTTCEDVFEPHTRSSTALVSGQTNSVTQSNGLVDYDSQEDSDFDPDACSDSESDSTDGSGSESESDEEEDIDLSDMFFESYGKGFLLHPPTNHELFGQKYFLDGWWMAKHRSWFFKSEFESKLLDLGAIKVSVKSSKKSATTRSSATKSATTKSATTKSATTKSATTKSATTKSATTKSQSSSDLSGMTFTKYGKGYILTTDETDSRYGTKYLLEDVDDGGFWNSNANGWFFRKMHYDLLTELGATYVKSEDSFVTSDTTVGVRPNINKYGKGFLLKADSHFKYTGDDMKYFEGGWYMPTKNGWFFRTTEAKAFMKKYNM